MENCGTTETLSSSSCDSSISSASKADFTSRRSDGDGLSRLVYSFSLLWVVFETSCSNFVIDSPVQIMIVSFLQILKESVEKCLPGAPRKAVELPAPAIWAMVSTIVVKGIIWIGVFR